MTAGGSALRVLEVPITFSDRTRGASKIGLLQLGAFGRRLMVLAGVWCRWEVRHALPPSRHGVRHRLYCLHRLVYGRGKFGGLSCRQFRSGHSFQLHAQLPMVVRSELGRLVTARLASIWAVPHRLPYGAFSPRRCFGNRNRCLGLGAETAILLAIASASIVNYLGSAFFVFPPASSRVSGAVRWRVSALGVTAISLEIGQRSQSQSRANRLR